MAKVAIKNENITSFGGIYHIMDVFSKLGFEKLTESVLGKRGSSGKAFSHGSIFGSLFFSYLCGGECLEDINALIGQFKQRPDTLLPGAETVGRGLKELTEKDIITFYNERGASEKNFDIQNNDFGWSHLPFSFMAENMVFIMVTAMLKNLYLYLVRHISDKVKPLKKTSRLKAFILHFVSVPAKWVRTGRQNVLNLYTNKTYYAEVFIE
mgnify:FL=1